MDKKASVMIYAMMVGIVIIILALALAPAVRDITYEARNATTIVNGVEKGGLDCSNSSISNYDKATCVVVDMNLFYFIGTLILIGGLIVTARVMFGGEE